MIAKQITLPVQGMTCASCVAHVEGALSELPGVEGAVVNLATGKANVTSEPARVTLAQMAKAVSKESFPLSLSGVGPGACGPECAHALTEASEPGG